MLKLKMEMLSTLPRHLDTKDLSNDANSLNVSVPAAAAAAFQLSTNFLNAVSIHNSAVLFIHFLCKTGNLETIASH